MSTSLLSEASSKYSIILSLGWKGFNSSKPIDLIAILISSSLSTPTERCCLRKKYLPASSMASKGMSPTNSEPVTRIPLAVAFLSTSSKAICVGVMLIFVRFIEICATPYSSINQPIPFTAFSAPGIITGLPFSSFTIFPVIGFPSLFVRPRSRTSKAIALARRVEVVFRLTLNATKKSRAPTAVTPLPATLSVNSLGPKSGFHSSVIMRSGRASYSPERQLARFLRTSVKAAFS